MSLTARLRERGLDPAGLLAHRIALHPEDACSDTADTAALLKAGDALFYERLQDGLCLARRRGVLAFGETGKGQAVFLGLRRMVARRPGNVPGDVVYDYDRAHLLHNFIARAAAPLIYDAFPEEGLSDWEGALVLDWPEDAPALRPASEL